MSIAAAHVPVPVSPTPARAFGRYRLRRLLGKSEATMTWLAEDTQAGVEVMLNLPRVAPAGAVALAAWMAAARRASRLDHPGLARVLACDVHEQWPYVAVDRRTGVTLDEWLAEHPRPTTDEAAFWIEEVLRALAFAHDAGVAHFDPQFHTLLVNERGQIAVMALGVAHESAADAAPSRDNDRAMPLDPRLPVLIGRPRKPQRPRKAPISSSRSCSMLRRPRRSCSATVA